MIRKCVFTGLEAKNKARLLYMDSSDEEVHNWTNAVPCNADYAIYRQSRDVNKIELECFKIFWEIELLRMMMKLQFNSFQEMTLKVLQERLSIIQEENTQKMRSWLKNKPETVTKKEKQIEVAYAQKEITEELNMDIDKFLENRKKLWE